MFGAIFITDNFTKQLIKSVKTQKDISPENVERQMKIKPVFNEKDHNEYSFSGNIFVQITANDASDKQAERQCVKMLIINVNK